MPGFATSPVDCLERAWNAKKGTGLAQVEPRRWLRLLPGDARRYAMLCLDVTDQPHVPAFYAGYAYEAMARAEGVGATRRLPSSTWPSREASPIA